MVYCERVGITVDGRLLGLENHHFESSMFTTKLSGYNERIKLHCDSRAYGNGMGIAIFMRCRHSSRGVPSEVPMNAGGLSMFLGIVVVPGLSMVESVVEAGKLGAFGVTSPRGWGSAISLKLGKGMTWWVLHG